jgi:hypothetical protein
MIPFTASLIAIYSAPVYDNDTQFCLREVYDTTADPYMNKYPDVERRVSMSPT